MEILLKLHERYERNIQGQLSYFDRIIVYGTQQRLAFEDLQAFIHAELEAVFTD